MSKPIPINPDDSLHGMVQHIMGEVVSAESALNMYPELLDSPKGEFLSQQDKWAEHCMEHLRQVFADLRVLYNKAEQVHYTNCGRYSNKK